jgi:hypothetical protein
MNGCVNAIEEDDDDDEEDENDQVEIEDEEEDDDDDGYSTKKDDLLMINEPDEETENNDNEQDENDLFEMVQVEDENNDEEDEEENDKDEGQQASENKEAATNCSILSTKSKNQCKYLFNTLIKAHNLVLEQKVYGSSTVCLLSLKFLNHNDNKNNEVSLNFRRRCVYMLSTCNLGDSGYMLIRNKQVIFKSQSQSHRFNAPFQIGCTPPELLDHDLYRDR